MTSRQHHSLIARQVEVRRGNRVVVDDVSFEARAEKIVGIIGPNGAGKSSLLMALFRSLELSAGEVLIDDFPLASMRRREIARNIAVVAQEAEDALPLSVRASVNLGRLSQRSLSGYGDNTDQEAVSRALRRVGIEHLGERLMTELSGGERQRALIARALVQDPNFLLLDEPTNHLDLHHQFALFSLVRSLSSTTVVVLHDLNLASQVCDELVLLHQGRVVRAGATAEVLDPELIGDTYEIACDVVEYQGRRQLLFAPRRNPENNQDIS